MIQARKLPGVFVFVYEFNTYTHLGLEDATDELRRMEDLENARKELEKNKEEKPVSQKMFRAI